jgi:NADPH:quinone reductase-like Zn-dependent oxidoreductase
VQTVRLEERVKDGDIVIDATGSKTLDASFKVLKPGGILASPVAEPD